MSRVPSHYFDKPTPLEQSKKGRRKPWYGFTEPRHIDEPSLEELEVGNDVYISYAENGLVEGGDKAWNEEHEAVMSWFHDPTSLCLVGGRFPDDHLDQIDELAFAARARGERVIASEAAILNSCLNGTGRVKLQKEGIEPWLKRSDAERQEIVLTTLGNSARADEAEDSYLVARYRKLVPEIQVKKLCSDGGMGLVRLFEFIAPYVLDASNLSTNPVYNEEFFRKFGITRSPDQLPLSLQDRAFQHEYLLKRHSMLFRFCRSLISVLESQEIPCVQEKKRSESSSFRVGSFRSEITATNCVEIADALSESPNSDPASRFTNCVDERCSTCLSKGERAAGSKLLYCERCKKVGRIQPYCSESCQRKDWRRHKNEGFCGTKLSSSSTVPIIDSTPSHPLGLYFLNKIIQNPKAFWFVQDQNKEEFAMSYRGNFIEINESMREIALKALRDQHQPSIDLLAFAVMEDAGTPMMEGRLDDGVITRTPPSNEVPSNDHRKAQFREMFDLVDDGKWKEGLKRGRLELDKPGNLRVKSFYYIHRKYPPGQTLKERKEWLMLDTLSSREWTDPMEQLKAMMDVTLLAPLSFT